MILLVQGCILAAARENGRIVPHPAGRIEGGLRGKRQRKKSASVSLSVLKEGRAEGRGGGEDGGVRECVTCSNGLLLSRKEINGLKNAVK